MCGINVCNLPQFYRKKASEEEDETESNESSSRPSTPEQTSQESNFKSPGSPAPKATPKRGAARGKAGYVESRSPSTHGIDSSIVWKKI